MKIIQQKKKEFLLIFVFFAEHGTYCSAGLRANY